MVMNVLSGMNYVQQQGELGQQQGQNRLLQGLAPDVIAGDPGALAKAAAVSPEAAGKYDKVGAELARRGAGLASFVLEAYKGGQGNPREVEARYQAGLPFLTKMAETIGRPPPAPTFDPTAVPAMEQFVAAYKARGMPEKAQQNLAVSPGSAIVDPETGQLIYERPFAPAKESWSVQQVPDGKGGTIQMEYNAASGEWRAPQYGGDRPQTRRPSPAQADWQQSSPARYVTDDGQPIPPNERAVAGEAFAANARGEDFFIPVPGGNQQPGGEPPPSAFNYPASNNAGGLGYTPPKAAGDDETFGQPQQVIGPDGKPSFVQFGNRGGLREVQGYNAEPKEATGQQKLSDDERKAQFANKELAIDAINFAAAFLGKTPEEVQAMSPAAIRDLMVRQGRNSSGPIVGRIPGASMTFNADLEAYSNSAAGKKARLNNPTGPVSNADFDIARKSIFGADKPDKVNADLVYQALTRKEGSGTTPAPAQTNQRPSPTSAPQPGTVQDGYRFRGGNPGDPNSWERI